MINTQRKEIYKGYTEEELRKTFAVIIDPNDWKAPICAIMPGEEVMLTVASIEFYTATSPKVDLNQKTMRYIVNSEGYRMGPAGDH